MSIDGSCIKLHRQKLINVFKTNGITSGVIIYRSPKDPKEPFSGSSKYFYQEGLFFWLTGWEKPDSIIVIDLATEKSVLLIPVYSQKYEIWTGPIPKVDDIIAQTGVDEISFLPELDNVIMSFNPDKIYSNRKFSTDDFSFKEKDANQEIKSVHVPLDTSDLLVACGISRRTKFPHEIDALRRASVVTSDALVLTMKDCRPGMNESNIEGSFAFHGSQSFHNHLSFLTIVASGKHAVYLHYRANNGIIKDEDLIVLDCGFYDSHYAGDVTRTFPANGKFSDDQKLVYGLLLEKQKLLIEAVKPNVSFSELNNMMHQYVFEILVKIGVIKEGTEFDKKYSSLFIPHSLSHHIGCNTHDVIYTRRTKSSQIDDDHERAYLLVPSMVLTIEPGIYFHKVMIENTRNDPQYEAMNIDIALHFAESVGGIRIEDDVLVTDSGHDVLSTCPKDIEDIEELMKHD